MEMSEGLSDTFDEGYIHQFQREHTHKILLAAAEAHINHHLLLNVYILLNVFGFYQTFLIVKSN